jgi:pentatricopeptide repeat protein
MSKTLLLLSALFLSSSIAFVPHHNHVKYPTSVQRQSQPRKSNLYVSQMDDPKLRSYEDYRDQLEAISFLSNMSGDGDLCQQAQATFDNMYERWFEEDDDSLEPTVEIYNFLIYIYSNCGDLKSAQDILEKMEEEGDNGIPAADADTYLGLMEGCGKSGRIDKAEEIFDRLRKEPEPTTELYNSMMSVWKKSGDWNAPQKAQDLLTEMISGSDNEELVVPSPNTETFHLAMECVSRNTPKSKSYKVAKQIEDLNESMEEEVKNGNNNLNPTHRDIINTRMKAQSLSKKKSIDAVGLLFGMIKRYRENNTESERPNAASFITAINARKYDKSKESAERASELLEVLENFYTLEIEAGNDRDDLKPDVRVYNAVMGIWSKSKAEKKAVETKARLFDKLQQALYDNTLECSDYASNLRSYNNVISAFTKGDKDGYHYRFRCQSFVRFDRKGERQ